MKYFYDDQLKRYIVQFMRIFTAVYTESDPDENGFRIQSRVPIKWGDMSRQVAQVITGQSENVVLSAPAMAAWISNLAIDNDRRNDSMWVSKITASEKKFDPVTQTYGNEVGNRYSVDRYMPVPYKISFNLDIWTTNTQTKLQILEQLLTIFNTSIQLQQNENPLDWTSVFEVDLVDVIWTNRTIPEGADVQHDIATLKFEVPVWINPPAKETHIKVIEKIVERVFEPVEDQDGEIDLGPVQFPGQCVVTSGMYGVEIIGHSDGDYNIATLTNKYGAPSDREWEEITDRYGSIVPGTTLLRLKTDDDLDSEDGDVWANIVAVDGKEMTIQIMKDTLPANSDVSPIYSIIDPTSMSPGTNLPAAQYGQRYLLSAETPDINDPLISPIHHVWGNITAYNNDIIEYNGSAWSVIFRAGDGKDDTYVTNLSDKQQYKYINGEWIYTFLGTYSGGYWSIENIEKPTEDT